MELGKSYEINDREATWQVVEIERLGGKVLFSIKRCAYVRVPWNVSSYFSGNKRFELRVLVGFMDIQSLHGRSGKKDLQKKPEWRSKDDRPESESVAKWLVTSFTGKRFNIVNLLQSK